jgi:hypothetical protein
MHEDAWMGSQGNIEVASKTQLPLYNLSGDGKIAAKWHPNGRKVRSGWGRTCMWRSREKYEQCQHWKVEIIERTVCR